MWLDEASAAMKKAREDKDRPEGSKEIDVRSLFIGLPCCLSVSVVLISCVALVVAWQAGA